MKITNEQSQTIQFQMQSNINLNIPFDVDFYDGIMEIRFEFHNFRIAIATGEENTLIYRASSSTYHKVDFGGPENFLKTFPAFLASLPTTANK